MMNKSEILKLCEIDGEFKEYLETHGMAPRPATLEERRNLMDDKATGAAGSTPHDIEEYVQKIPMHDQHTSQAIVVRLKSSSSSHRPLIILYFGGGFCSGSALQMVPYGRGLARLFDAVVVCCDYRLAPEHAFPASPLDAYATLEWCAKNATSLGAEPERGLIVGGVSAGGNLSGVISAMALEKGLQPKVTGQWLSVPCFFEAGTVPEGYQESWVSRKENEAAPGLNKQSMEGMLGLYKADPMSPLYNPLQSKAQLRDLPPAYIQVDGMDPLLADGLIYGDILEKAGVKVRLDAYSGQVHAHWTSYPSLTASRKAMVDIMKGVGWLLGVELKDEQQIVKAIQVAGAG